MVVAATGFFDGVHLGHRAVLNTLKEKAKELKQQSAVITFWPHPRNVLQQDACDLRLLNTLEEKKELVLGMGIDQIIVIPFTKDFSKLDSKSFLKQYLVEQYKVSTLIIGYDHRLGSTVDQTQQQLISIAESLGIHAVIVKQVSQDGMMVSSTKIRNVLSVGDVHNANEMLGYHYSLHGVVVVGNKIGRTIGYPTANMQLYEPLKLVPGNGVYVVKVRVLGGDYYGICNIGKRPTIGDNNQRTIETHILDFNEDIYGLDIKIDFLERIRAEHKFSSLQALTKQLAMDERFARKFISK